MLSNKGIREINDCRDTEENIVRYWKLCCKTLLTWKDCLKKVSCRGTLFAPFWCLCQKLSLSPLYFNKTLLHKSSERSSLISGPGLNSSPPGAKNPGVFVWFNNNLSSWGLVRDPSGQGKDAWSFSSLFS